MSPTPLSRLSSERGSLLIEVLVAAVLVAVMGAALFGALDSSAKVSGVAKARAGAAAVAQDDQERMRAMPIVALNNMRQHRDPIVVGQIAYVVDSRADWIADASGGTDCTANGKAADYLKITSTVDAKNVPGLKPVVVTSTVTPAPGTFQGNEGSEAVTVVNRNGVGIPGLTVTISGPTTASDTTDANGCAFFGYEPAGSYTGNVVAPGYVNVNGYAAGSANASFGVTIAAGTVSTDQVKFDLGGKAAATFETKRIIPPVATPPNTETLPSKQGYLGLSNGGVTINQGVRAFGDGTPQATITTDTSLFPFTTAYNVFAGDCYNNDPGKYGVTGTDLPLAIILPAENPHVVNPVRVPALNLTTLWNGAATGDLTVTITSTTSGCTSRTIVVPKTNNGSSVAARKGLLDDPGLPYGTYKICVDNRNNTSLGTVRRTATVTKTINAADGTAAFTMDPKSSTTFSQCQNPLP